MGKKLSFLLNEVFSHVAELLNERVHSHPLSHSPRIGPHVPPLGAGWMPQKIHDHSFSGIPFCEYTLSILFFFKKKFFFETSWSQCCLLELCRINILPTFIFYFYWVLTLKIIIGVSGSGGLCTHLLPALCRRQPLAFSLFFCLVWFFLSRPVKAHVFAHIVFICFWKVFIVDL